MKTLLLFVALIVGGGFYVHQEQPELWNKWMQQTHTQLAKVPQLQPLVQKLWPASGKPDAAPSEYVNPSPGAFPGSAHVTDVPQSDVPQANVPAANQRTFTPPATLPAQPNWTWTTTDGQHVYKNVVVCKVEADCVTILDDDGGARIDIASLPLEIQKQLNYDPDLAAEATTNRQQQEQTSQAAMSLERQKTAEIAKAKSASEDTNDAAILTGAANKRSAVDAAVRVQQAQTELANWQQDLTITKTHLGASPTGQMMGDTYWMSKYDEDNANIAQLNDIISSGGKK
jgi:hypothetical protein